MTSSTLKERVLATMKSEDTEGAFELYVTRTPGYLWALLFKRLHVHPIAVTLMSIVIGALAGYFFWPDNLYMNLIGMFLLVWANWYDCADGQLARMTGQKTLIGRILDGFAGDIWFACIYVAFALRLSHEYGTHWFFALAVLSGMSHLMQANITDYYKTLHLYFISKDKGAEFQSLEQVRARHKEMKYGINKFFYFLYRGYTLLQVKATPSLQRMLACLHARYGDDIPQDLHR